MFARRGFEQAKAIFVTLLWLLAPVSPAAAVIRVDIRISAIYDVAKVVLIGKTIRLDNSTKTAEVETSEVVKGDFHNRKLRLQFATLPDRLRDFRVNEPVVIFIGARVTSIHAGDYFWTADPVLRSEPPTWRVTKKHPIGTRFPGRTVALIDVVHQLKTGHATLMNEMEHKVWRGGIRNWGSVMPKASYIVATDLTGDGKAELLLGNADRVQLLVNAGHRFVDRTKDWGLADAKGNWAAFADLNANNRIDVLIGKQIWINQGDHFLEGDKLALADDFKPLTVGLLDVTGNGKPDIAFLTRTGEVRIFQNPGPAGGSWTELPPRSLWSGGEEAVAASFSSDWGDTGKTHVMVVRPSGITRYALQADGGAPADFERLTGETLESFNKLKHQTRWNVAGAVTLDINGDGRKDFIVFHDDGGPTFVNRGFGMFFLSTEPAVAIRRYEGEEVPWSVTRGTRFGAGDIHGDKFDDLLIVTEDGKLFELDNTPYRQFVD